MQQIHSGYKMCISTSTEMAENKQHCCLARSSLSDCLSMTDVFISFGLAGNIQCSWYSVLSQAETKQNAFLSHSASNFTVAVNSEMQNCGEKMRQVEDKLLLVKQSKKDGRFFCLFWFVFLAPFKHILKHIECKNFITYNIIVTLNFMTKDNLAPILIARIY